MLNFDEADGSTPVPSVKSPTPPPPHSHGGVNLSPIVEDGSPRVHASSSEGVDPQSPVARASSDSRKEADEDGSEGQEENTGGDDGRNRVEERETVEGGQHQENETEGDTQAPGEAAEPQRAESPIESPRWLPNSPLPDAPPEDVERAALEVARELAESVVEKATASIGDSEEEAAQP